MKLLDRSGVTHSAKLLTEAQLGEALDVVDRAQLGRVDDDTVKAALRRVLHLSTGTPETEALVVFPLSAANVILAASMACMARARGLHAGSADDCLR